MKSITSRQNDTYKSLLALATEAREQKKRRQTIIDGVHLLQVYCQRYGAPRQLLLAESAIDHPEILALRTELATTETLLLRDSLFRELSGMPAPMGIAAVIEIPPEATELAADHSCVLLDGVQDAGNVGSILRTTAAAGISDVFLSPGCASAWSPRVLRAAQGAHFSLAIREHADLRTLLENFSGISIATVVSTQQQIYELDLRSPLAWVFGNEGAGVSAAVVAATSKQATIPLAASTESLNVAAAAAICLFEGRRQQQA